MAFAMNIRSRVLGSALLAVAATLACVAMLWIGASRSLAADAEQEKVQATSRAIANMLLLTQEYALHFEQRAAEQWQNEHASLTHVLSAAVQSGDSSPAHLAMRSSAADLPGLFARLTELAALPESALAERRRELVVDQLLNRTQGLADSAYRWSREAAAAEQAARRWLRIGGALALLLLLAAAIAQPIVVWRRVLRPLSVLERTAAAIERGDLSARCASTAQDELGRASRRFDAMTSALGERGELLQRSEQRLRAIADNMPALITQIDASERYTFVNAYIERALGIDPATLTGKTMREVCGERLYARTAGSIHLALTGENATFETQLAVGGARRHFQSNYIPDIGDDGKVRGFYGISFDVTERKESELRQAAGERRLRTITDNLPVLIAYIDSEHRFRFCNATCEKWFGLPASGVEGRAVAEVLGDDLYAQRRPFIARALAGERVESEQDVMLAGGTRHLHALYIPHQEEGRTLGLYALISDVTAGKQAEAKLLQMARFDSLTGLANRRQLEERLPEAMARARRSGAPMALLFLDIDHFKSINDTQGHAAGDDVLKQFALRLRDTVRVTDTVARLGGDEFVVVIEALHGADEAAHVAGKIVTAMRRPWLLAGRSLTATTSIGVAGYDGAEIASAALMARADAALYEAKKAGRDGWCVHQPIAPRLPALVRV